MLDNKTIYQVDAFADEVFKGNPAGVMILDKLPKEDWMQNMAAEMNLSETAFIAPISNSFEIRFFTPTVEIPLCGHATLASAHIMYELGIKAPDELILFKAKGGDLAISKDGDFISMVFPKYSFSKIEIPNNFETLIGFYPISAYKSADWIIAIAEQQEDIENCKPNFEVLQSNGLGHLMITSKGKENNVDFVVRCFVPEMGINEDPVTGSAHCALTPLWSSRLTKTQMISNQISKRGGVLKVAMIGNEVLIKGKAITVFRADLNI